MQTKNRHIFKSLLIITCLFIVAIPYARANTNVPGLAAAYLSALHAQYISDPLAASKFLDSALQIDPENPKILYWAFLQKAQAGSINSSATHATQILKKNPDIALANLLLAISNYKKGEFQNARRLINSIPDRSPIGVALPLVRAWANAPVAKIEETLQALSPYNGYKDWAVLSKLMSGMIKEYYGEHESALKTYESIAGQPNTLTISTVRILAEGFIRLNHVNNAQSLIKNFSTSSHQYSLLKEYLENIGRPVKERSELTAQKGMAEALYTATQLSLIKPRKPSNIQLPLIFGNLALHLNPDLNSLTRQIASNIGSHGHYKIANKMLQKINKKDPNYTLAQIMLADHLDLQGDTEEAIRILKKIVRNKPKSPEPLIKMADILRKNEQYDTAIEYYDQAFDKYPNQQPKAWYLFYSRGMALERAKEWRRAESDFTRALEIEPEQPEVLNYLAYCWLERGERIIEARNLINIALSKNPNNGYIIDSLGWAMFIMGDYKDAVRQLERAVTIAPSDPTINDHLGDAYWQVGRRTEAQFQWRRTLTMNPEPEIVDNIQAKLENGFNKLKYKQRSNNLQRLIK